MSQRIRKAASLFVATAGLTGLAFAGAAPAAHASTGELPIVTSPCPPGYYGVAVYDQRGKIIAFACVL